MYRKLPDHRKSLVIRQWLAGVQRDKIAGDDGISAGAVTNVVNEWRRGLGEGVIDDLRELGVTLRNSGITPAQCALGHRTAMLISKLGVKEEELDSFILDLYNRLTDFGLSPENIAFHIKDLLEFSRANSDIAVPLSQITEYIQQKADEKKKLEEQIQTLKSQVKTLSEEKSNSEYRRNSALYEEHMTNGELKSYSDLKGELGQYGIPIYDIPKFAKAVKGLSHKGYGVDKIITEYSEYNAFKDEYFSYKAQILELENKCSQLQGSTNYYTQRLSIIDNLQSIGFGFKELKSLWHTIVEVSDANNISREDAVKRFFKEIEDHYDDILGFKLRKHELEAEVNDLGRQKLKLVAYLNAFRKFGGPFEKLLGIMNSTSPEEVNLLIDKLHRVGGVRTAIEILSNKLTLSVRHETNALLNTNTNNNKNDGDGNNSKTEKSITSESAHLSITYQENSSTGQLASDKIAGLSIDDRIQDDNCGNENGKEKQKERKIFAQDDHDPSFKHQINDLVKWLPSSLKGDNGIENKDKQVQNNDSLANIFSYTSIQQQSKRSDSL